MTVEFLGEQDSARSGKNSQGLRTYTRVFNLHTSVRTDGVFEVGSHSMLPRINDPYPGDQIARCSSLKVTNSDPWRGWTVTASYSTKERDQPDGDPTAADAKVS